MKSNHTRILPVLVAVVLAGCADNKHRMVVSVTQQRMALFEEDEIVTVFPVSTSKFCLSDTPGSYGTPLGRHEVAKKIGDGAPAGMKFASRQPTGEIVQPNSPGRDPIVTRILWLRGKEPWNANSYDRNIYIHGTAEESKLGRPASYGCVRMASQHVLWLYDRVGKGARVDILPGPLPPPDQLPP